MVAPGYKPVYPSDGSDEYMTAAGSRPQTPRGPRSHAMHGDTPVDPTEDERQEQALNQALQMLNHQHTDTGINSAIQNAVATALASQQGNQLATRDHHAAFMQNFAPRPQSTFDVEGFWLSVDARQQKLLHN